MKYLLYTLETDDPDTELASLMEAASASGVFNVTPVLSQDGSIVILPFNTDADGVTVEGVYRLLLTIDELRAEQEANPEVWEAEEEGQ